MDNELKDIANKLCPYDSISDGWSIISAEKLQGGNWRLEIQPHVVKEDEAKKEAADDNN